VYSFSLAVTAAALLRTAPIASKKKFYLVATDLLICLGALKQR
jgi:hypothetical protein